jgi:hypothetical protein
LRDSEFEEEQVSMTSVAAPICTDCTGTLVNAQVGRAERIAKEEPLGTAAREGFSL